MQRLGLPGWVIMMWFPVRLLMNPRRSNTRAMRSPESSGKVFDAHLGANKFDFRGLDANSLLLFPVGLSFNVVPLHQVFEHD